MAGDVATTMRTLSILPCTSDRESRGQSRASRWLPRPDVWLARCETLLTWTSWLPNTRHDCRATATAGDLPTELPTPRGHDLGLTVAPEL
jgi:hypothetical protein